MKPAAPLLAGSLVIAAPALAHQATWPQGPLVAVEVRVDGLSAPLYPARDGSGRSYLEARKGKEYDIVLRNCSAERLGVALVVDGLNVVSGERAEASSPHNRMYILDAWGEVSVRGWRTSLSEVRRFHFVDERSSYAARSGKDTRKLGWIEVGVFREQGRWLRQQPPFHPLEPDVDVYRRDAPEREPEADAKSEAPPAAREQAEGVGSSRAPRSYPGTGWGRETYDPARLVSFDPMPSPAQLTTLRYEYASALRALGILPQPWWGRDRLREREQGQDGFAPPPVW
jgi:hypothetical protein